ncbi:magnesium chelatase domain-containing protein [Streptomyces mirabilis]|uniref:magnesium chelatase domain-containing protein n=1 Tax=Streptomyces mirabilis TaxID=68239 RepID=UPI003327586D
MSFDRIGFMQQANQRFRDSLIGMGSGGNSTGLPAVHGVPQAMNHAAAALLQRDPTTAALSQAAEDALQAAHRARSALMLHSIDYIARLVRQELPSADAITIDCQERNMREVFDKKGNTIWSVPASSTSRLRDGIVEDIDAMLNDVIPFGGLTEAGWRYSTESIAYRTVFLPTRAQRGTVAAHYPASRAHGEIRAEYTPGGTPAFDLDGLDDACVRETRDRIRAAIVNTGLEWEPGHMRITAHWTVTYGYSADLALACTALAAAGAINPAALNGVALIGELGLDGRVRPVRNAAAAVRMAQEAGYLNFIVAADDFDKLSRNDVITPVGVNDVAAALSFLEEMHEPTTSTEPNTRPQGTPGEDAGQCAQCDRPLIWDGTGNRLNDEWGEYICTGPKTSGSNVHVLAK